MCDPMNARCLAALVSTGVLIGSTLGFSALERTRDDGAAARAPVDHRLNERGSSTQDAVAFAVDSSGRVFAAWQSRRQQGGKYGVAGRVFSSAGEPLSPEFTLTRSRQGAQMQPDVAFAPDGRAWAVWMSVGQDGDQGSIVARSFSPDFSEASDELLVNQTHAGHQHNASIAVNRAGEALIVWMTPTERGTRLAARLMRADGSPRTEERFIPQPDEAGGHDSLPVVAARPDGSFLIVFARAGLDGAPRAIMMQRIDAEGAFIDETPGILQDDDGSRHYEPALAVADDGSFLVAWMRGYEEHHAVVARRFSATGEPLSGLLLAAVADESAEAGWLSGPAVVIDPHTREGIIAYNLHARDNDPANIFARRLANDGEGIGPVFGLTACDEGLQYLQPGTNAKRLAIAADGALLAVWAGNANLDDRDGAHLSILPPASPRAAAVATRVPVRLASELETTGAALAAVTAPIPPIWMPLRTPMPPAGVDLNPGPDMGFLGVNFTGWTPPDPELAVGPDHLVTVTNGSIAFFDKNGNNLFQQALEGGGGFWGQQGATGFVFDPECLYDPHSGRFFAMACERATGAQSMYLLAVSDDSNPLGPWHKYRINVTHVDDDIDSPNMSVDEHHVYLSADFFGPDKYQFLMIEKAPLLDGGGINSREVVFTGAGNQSMGIPINYDTGSEVAYILQSSEGTGNGVNFNEVRFHAVRQQLTTPVVTSVDVNVPTYAYPNQPPQQGTSVRPFLFEPRFWSCVVRNGSLWAVHHVNAQRARARWYEFKLNGWPISQTPPTLHQWGELDYGAGVHTFFPSIGVDEENNAVIVFSRSSPSEFISIGRAYRRHDDPLNTFRPMEFVKQSTVPYTGASRWGDYSGSKPEVSEPGVFWVHHQWTDVSNAWRTWLARVDTRPGTFDIDAAEITFGTLLEGNADSLRTSDDVYLRARSSFGFTALEPNLVNLQVGMLLDGPRPTTFDLNVESRINHTSGTQTIRVRRWSDAFNVVVAQNTIGNTDQTAHVAGLDASVYVRESDGRVDVQVRHVVLATFTALGFQSFFDLVEARSN